jgi:hypothetical protein
MGKVHLSNRNVFLDQGRKAGRTDLNINTNPGRGPDENIAAVIAGKFDANRHLSARKLVQSLRTAVSAVCRYLTEVWG